jgi:hypothetical protein
MIDETCKDCEEKCDSNQQTQCANMDKYMDAMHKNMQAAIDMFGEHIAFNATTTVVNTAFVKLLKEMYESVTAQLTKSAGSTVH